MTAETHPVEREQLMAYLDGELAAGDAARVAGHLKECAECRQLEADLLSVSSQMLAWNVEPAPPQISENVLGLIQANPPQGSVKEAHDLAIEFTFGRRMRVGRWILAAACLGVVAMILVKVFVPSTVSTFRVEQGEKLASDSRLIPLDRFSTDNSKGSGGAGGEREERKLTLPPVTSAPPVHRLKKAPNADDASSMNRNLNSVAPSTPLPQPKADLLAKRELLKESNGDSVVAPMIARTASLKISAKDFQSARAGVDRIIASFHGFAASMTINNAIGEPQSLSAELHFPAAQCDAALAALKSLGRVEQEQQGGDEVTAQVVDLDARLKNARETETRLQDILKTRTGKVSDVLEVEKEIADTRQSIEQMEGEQKQLHNRITFSAITLELHEEYQASLETNEPSAGRRIRNAVVDGFRAAAEGSLALLVFLLSAGPSLLLAVILLFWPARWAWRRLASRPHSEAAAH
jgi:Domain of unknown function (DUF4349)/Putative zinc-finger